MNIRPQISTPELTLCKDCRFHKVPFLDRLARNPEGARCLHEMAAYTDAVTGKRQRRLCSTMRYMGCGAKAYLFEPKRDDVIPVVQFSEAAE